MNPAPPGDGPGEPSAPGGIVDDRPSDFAVGDGPGETIAEFAQRTGQKRKTIDRQIQRGIFERQNPGYTAVRGPDRTLVIPIA